ncbi:hypothetical protein CKAH01_15232 [Colletotrichum kahawae]|uniref:Uncharacterized protein n=1 Tax=Colletotrichum kahawae TaxID=34407 RepID=A0AAE0DAN5_COLKA|nr:hypothetical protein CKAH01_15232 [Colletotrichum kahawae]
MGTSHHPSVNPQLAKEQIILNHLHPHFGKNVDQLTTLPAPRNKHHVGYVPSPSLRPLARRPLRISD